MDHARRHRAAHHRAGNRSACIAYVTASDHLEALDECVISDDWYRHLVACQLAADTARQAGCTVLITPLPLDDWLDYCDIEGINTDDTSELAFWLSALVPRAQFTELADGSVLDEALAEMFDTGAHDALENHIISGFDDDPTWDADAFYAGAPGTWERIEPLAAELEATLGVHAGEFIAEVDSLFAGVTDGHVVQVEVHVAADHPAAICDDEVMQTQQVHCQRWVAIVDQERLGYGDPHVMRNAVLWALTVGGSAAAYTRTFPSGVPDDGAIELRSWVFDHGTIARF